MRIICPLYRLRAIKIASQGIVRIYADLCERIDLVDGLGSGCHTLIAQVSR